MSVAVTKGIDLSHNGVLERGALGAGHDGKWP